jgi:hypothetical protein
VSVARSASAALHAFVPYGMNTDNRDIPRREFAKTTAAAAFGLATSRVAPSVLAPSRRSAGEKVVVAICGVNSRGLDHAQNFSKIANAEVAYIGGVKVSIDSNTGRILGDAGAMKLWSRRYEPGWAPTA